MKTIILIGILLFSSISFAGTRVQITVDNQFSKSLFTLHQVSQHCMHNGQTGHWIGQLLPDQKHVGTLDATSSGYDCYFDSNSYVEFAIYAGPISSKTVFDVFRANISRGESDIDIRLNKSHCFEVLGDGTANHFTLYYDPKLSSCILPDSNNN